MRVGPGEVAAAASTRRLGPSRRQFLRRALGAAAGTALLPWLVRCAPSTATPPRAGGVPASSPVMGDAPVRANPDGPPRALLPHFLGYNGKVVQVPPWTDPRFLDAVVDLNPGTLRYPPGTWGNYWDWKTGWFVAGSNPPGTSAQKPPDPRKLDDLRIAIDATGAVPIFVLNMITATLDDQLAMLRAARQLGLPVHPIELGNELAISGNPDFLRRFPTAGDYGREASRWAAAVKGEFPEARIAAVGSAEGPNGGGKARARGWNRALLPNLRGIDALTFHLYPRPALLSGAQQQQEAQLSEGGPGTAALQTAEAATLATSEGAAAFLGQPFRAWAELAPVVAALPAGLEAWITEYNLGDPSGAVFGTWAHGLFVATLTLLLLGEPRVALACNHVLASNAGPGNGAFAAIYCSDHAFAGFADAPPTTPYALSPAGAALRLLSRALRGRTAAQRLAITPELSEGGADRYAYPSILGWSFGDVSATQAVLLNLADRAIRVDTASLPLEATQFEQLSGVPHLRLPGAGALTRVAGSPGVALALPPYSLTRLASA